MLGVYRILGFLNGFSVIKGLKGLRGLKGSLGSKGSKGFYGSYLGLSGLKSFRLSLWVFVILRVFMVFMGLRVV